ncbi:IS3 family transposase [Nitrospira sp. MA-1]|nr:IS3 family transposase [Nitrospira sp. MA-1]
MTKGRFADEFKEEAVKQVIERGYAVGDVAKRLGISVQSLYKWVKVYSPNATDRYEAELKEVRRENLKLKAELSRAQEERDLLKKNGRVLCEKPGVRYAFILQHQDRYAVQPMCRLLDISRSGYDAWVERPPSQQAQGDDRLLGLIRESHEASGRTYGAPRILCDLREVGERVGKNRIAKIMKRHKIRAQRGYKQPGIRYTKPAVTAPTRLQQQFAIDRPDCAWATDITSIRTYEGWLYLAVVMDLYSRRIIGWSMKSTLAKEIVLDAFLMAVWRRKPEHDVIIHSDQGSQFSSDEWNRFCQTHGLRPSMSRRGNCYDNAAVESFFGTLKKEKIRRHIFKTREAARAEIFDYIEVFYHRARRHQHLGNISPTAYEQQMAN